MDKDPKEGVIYYIETQTLTLTLFLAPRIRWIRASGSLSILPIVPALLGQRGHTVPLPTFPWDKATGMRLYARLKTIQRGYTQNVISGLQILASGSIPPFYPLRNRTCVSATEKIFLSLGLHELELIYEYIYIYIIYNNDSRNYF